MSWKYVIVNEKELDFMKNQINIDMIEAEELVWYRDIFIKFLDKTRLSYQIELCKWTFRGKEEKLYRSIETIDEIKKELEWFKDTYKKFKEKKDKK